MLTKSDLTAIQSLFDKRFESINTRFDCMDEKFESIDTRFDCMDEKFEIIDKRFESMDEKFASKEDVQKSTSELVELITIGFERMDKGIKKLSEHDDMIENHERRLDKIEDKLFA